MRSHNHPTNIPQSIRLKLSDGGTAAGDVLARLEEEVRFIGWEVGGAATDLCGWVSEYRL